jgi:hypothetical protein
MLRHSQQMRSSPPKTSSRRLRHINDLPREEAPPPRVERFVGYGQPRQNECRESAEVRPGALGEHRCAWEESVEISLSDEIGLIALGVDPERHAEILSERIKEIGMRTRLSPTGNGVAATLSLSRLKDWECEAFMKDGADDELASEAAFEAECAPPLKFAVAIMSLIARELPAYFESCWLDRAGLQERSRRDVLVYLLYEGQRRLLRILALADEAEKSGLVKEAGQLMSTAARLEDHLDQLSLVLPEKY